MQLRTRLGQAFEAAIPFTLSAGESLSPLCIRGNQDAGSFNQHIPLLANARFDIILTGAGGEIMVRTARPVNEPALRVRLTIDCGPTLSLAREFVALLDAPVIHAGPDAQMAQGVSPPVTAREPGSLLAPLTATPKARRPARPRAPGTSPVLAPARPAATRQAGMPSRAIASRPAGAEPRFRLSLSRPMVDMPEEPVNLKLKQSEELSSLAAPVRTYSPAELESLKIESRIRLSMDPLAEAAKLQVRLTGLATGMTEMRRQLGDLDVARRSAEDHARRLAEENRRLSSWLTGIGFALLLATFALLLALAFWRYRVAAEARGARARAWQMRDQPPAPAAEATESDLVDHQGAAARASLPPSRPAAPAELPVPETPYTRTVVLDARSPALVRDPDNMTTPVTDITLAQKPGLRLLDDPEINFEIPPPAPGGEVAPRGLPTPASTATGSLVPSPRGRAPTLERPSDPVGQQAPAADYLDINFSAGEELSLSPPGIQSPEREQALRYLSEFERKLFPEVALGRVALDDPRSIVGLARTYYQEDFDAAKAISFLEYALHRTDRIADPQRIHLALLEVLRMERKVRDYTARALTFRDTYPASAAQWQLIAAYGRLLSPADPVFAGAPIPGLDLDAPSNWLGSTLDMTKYVLGQKVSASIRDLPMPAPEPIR